jgi:hypothetical protein
MATRQTTPPDSRFADLLAPAAAKPDQSGSGLDGPPAPVNLPADQTKGSVQPAEAAMVEPSRNSGDDAASQPPQVALRAVKLSDLGQSQAIEPGSLQPATPGSDELRPQRAIRSDAGAGVTLQPPATGIAVAADAVDQAQRTSCAQPDTTSSDDWLAAATGSAESPEQNTTVAPPPIPGNIVAVAEPLIKSAVGEVPAPGTIDPSKNVASGNSAKPLEADARTHASPMLRGGAVKTSPVIATATVGDETTGRHRSAVPHSNGAESTSVASAAVGAHAASPSQPGVAISSHEPRSGTVAATSPPAQDFATAQPGEATSPATAAIMSMSAPSTARPAGTVAAATTDPGTLAKPRLDQTDLQPDTAAMPAKAASTLPAGNGFAVASLQQNEPHDERSDAAATPLYNTGFATLTAPTSASVSPPAGLPSVPPTGSAMQ